MNKQIEEMARTMCDLSDAIAELKKKYTEDVK